MQGVLETRYELFSLQDTFELTWDSYLHTIIPFIFIFGKKILIVPMQDKYNPLERHRADKDGGPTCQKCLQKGHWTFQCKNDAVYQKRPTRTKQFLDPKVCLFA